MPRGTVLVVCVPSHRLQREKSQWCPAHRLSYRRAQHLYALFVRQVPPLLRGQLSVRMTALRPLTTADLRRAFRRSVQGQMTFQECTPEPELPDGQTRAGENGKPHYLCPGRRSASWQHGARKTNLFPNLCKTQEMDGGAQESVWARYWSIRAQTTRPKEKWFPPSNQAAQPASLSSLSSMITSVYVLFSDHCPST